MLYVSSVVPAGDLDNVISAGSQMSALLPTELAQHLDTYDGSSLGDWLVLFLFLFH